MIKYSFVVPIYKDGALAGEFCEEFQRVFRGYLGKDAIEDDVEVIFVNDGSPNDSYAILRDQVCPRFAFAKAIDLSRNFGQPVAISAGYRHARGQYVGTLNVDMEDPPAELIPLLEAIQSGEFDFVGGRYKSRDVPLMNKVTSNLFSRLLNRLTGYAVPLDMASSRVMNRRFVDEYNRLTETSRYIPALESWMGFRRGWVMISHQRRTRGTSSYDFKRRMLMALDAIVSFSDLPLKMVAASGMLIAAVGFAMMALLIVGKLFFTDFRPGFTSTVSVIVFMGGVQIIVTGVASLYIGRILREAQGRPLYIVRDSCGVEARSSDQPPLA
jgi:glycosyltransferase involved in cell wall biosynthesis